MNGYCDLSLLSLLFAVYFVALSLNNNYNDGLRSKVIGAVYAYKIEAKEKIA